MNGARADDHPQRTEPLRPRVTIRLFGAMEVEVNGVSVIDPGSRRLQALVALLALHPSESFGRDSLARRLWPDAEAGQDLRNLRRLLFAFRRRWPRLAACLCIDAMGLRWRYPSHVSVDVVNFHRLAEVASNESELRRVLGLYRGDFLEGANDLWIQVERERCRSVLASIAERLAQLLEEERRYGDAFRMIASLTPLPADESLCERFLGLAALSGGARQVDRAYGLIVERFLSQFEDAPTPRLKATMERLKAAGIPQPMREPLVDRQTEWLHLVRGWETSQAGRPTLIWLQGEAGIGKTSLLKELRAWSRAHGASVFEGQAVGDASWPLLAPVVEALGGDPGWVSAPTSARHLGTLQPRDVRMRQFSMLLTTLLLNQPAILTLDDMHNADPDTWQWLRFALNARTEARILVVAASRDDPRPTVLRKDLFEALAGHVVRSVLTVRPLPPADARRVVEGQSRLSPDTMRRVVDLGKGNPLLLLELARLADQSGGGVDALSLGPTYEAALKMRLEALRPEERRLLQAMAIAERPCRLELLVQVVRTARRRTVDHLVELQMAAVDESGSVTLAHDLLRAPVLATLSSSRRRDLAGALAAVASSQPGGLGEYAIARLWEQAGRLDKAQSWYRRAASGWESRLSLGEALPALEALVRLSTPRERCTYQVRLADLLYAWGERAGAREAYREAIPLALEQGCPDVAAEARVGLGRVLGDEGDVEGAVRQLDESIAFFRAEKAPRALALALLRRAEIVGFRADYARARALLGEARDLCLRIGDGALEAETLNNLGYLEYELGHLSRSRDLCARALAVAEVAGSASGVLMATGNLGVVHRELGQIRAAASYQRDAADLAHQNHLRQDLCYALGNLGACYQDVGQWEDARACVRTAYRLANDLHDARALSIIANLMAEQFSQTGHDGLADGWWALALSVAKAFGMPRHVAWYAGAWAEVLLNAGRTAEAAVVLREGWPRRRWARDVERLGLRAQYVRWAYAVGRLSADQARRRLLEACQATKDVQALAVGQYVTWQVSGRLDDRRTAQASVNAVLATHPQVRWQKYGLTLGADVLRLPALEPPPVWLELEAPTDDCDPEPVWLGRWASRRLDLGPDGPPDRAEGR